METIAFAAFGILVYTLVGYPILIALLARLLPQRLRTDPAFEPTVTACIPVYNAAPWIGPKVESLLAQDYPPDKLEILLYTDGCTDESEAAIAAYAARDPRVKLIASRERRGKPTGLARMLEAARGEVLLMTDIRQILAPHTLRALLAALSDPRVGTVGGNLELRGGSGAGLYWRYEQWMRNSEARFRSMLGTLGSLYVIRKADVPPIPSDTILDDLWVPMSLRLQGRRLLFCKEGIAYDDAFDDDREFGRKVRTLTGNYQLFSRMPRLLVPFLNPSWLETWSHKILRLLLPWALLALLVASALGAPDSRPLQILLLGQLGFYALALAGGRLGPLGRFARTFVVLNAATVVALGRHLRGAQRVTW